MLISKKNRVLIFRQLFQEGVLYAKKDYFAAKHCELDVPNLEVIKLMQSLHSRSLVREVFNWRHYYWALTNEGIQYIRDQLHLEEVVVPKTLKRPVKSTPDRRMGDRPMRRDRDDYRRGPKEAGAYAPKFRRPE
eukprot:gnl/Trimastix_PCT/21.p1 GENE.gnl/Trimastix_PCT/21~~gnl/Trimastix_PCT/21.p1  ORF type:complete len:134 (+),score=45.20 gnl/Trimastix_PCT/21:54-455(+)